MNINDLLTSPPPATGWTLDTGMAAVVRRQEKTGLRCAAVEMPGDVFEVGPVGLQTVDEDKLRPILARLQDEVEGSKRAAVVVPTGWLRTHMLEFDKLPRRQADVQDMVMWRLKKMLPVPPSSLRLAMVSQPPAGGRRRLLILVGVERALATLESVFESVGVSPGIITPRVFAGANPGAAASPILTIQQEKGFLSIMLLVDGEPQLVRTKPLPVTDWRVVERELNLTQGYIKTGLGLDSGLSVGFSVEDDALADHLSRWLESSEKMSPLVAAPPSLVFDGTVVRDRVGPFRLDPVINVMSGGVR